MQLPVSRYAAPAAKLESALARVSTELRDFVRVSGKLAAVKGKIASHAYESDRMRVLCRSQKSFDRRYTSLR